MLSLELQVNFIRIPLAATIALPLASPRSLFLLFARSIFVQIFLRLSFLCHSFCLPSSRWPGIGVVSFLRDPGDMLWHFAGRDHDGSRQDA